LFLNNIDSSLITLFNSSNLTKKENKFSLEKENLFSFLLEKQIPNFNIRLINDTLSISSKKKIESYDDFNTFYNVNLVTENAQQVSNLNYLPAEHFLFNSKLLKSFDNSLLPNKYFQNEITSILYDPLNKYEFYKGLNNLEYNFNSLHPLTKLKFNSLGLSSNDFELSSINDFSYEHVLSIVHLSQRKRWNPFISLFLELFNVRTKNEFFIIFGHIPVVFIYIYFYENWNYLNTMHYTLPLQQFLDFFSHNGFMKLTNVLSR